MSQWAERADRLVADVERLLPAVGGQLVGWIGRLHHRLRRGDTVPQAWGGIDPHGRVDEDVRALVSAAIAALTEMPDDVADVVVARLQHIARRRSDADGLAIHCPTCQQQGRSPSRIGWILDDGREGLIVEHETHESPPDAALQVKAIHNLPSPRTLRLADAEQVPASVDVVLRCAAHGDVVLDGKALERKVRKMRGGT